MSAATLPQGVEIRPRLVAPAMGRSHEVLDILLHGRFVIGCSGWREVHETLGHLVENDWRWLRSYGMEARPMDWLDRVDREAWTYTDALRLQQPDRNGRACFGGNVNEYSAAFCYWIWDLDLLRVVERRLATQVLAHGPRVLPPGRSGSCTRSAPRVMQV